MKSNFKTALLGFALGATFTGLVIGTYFRFIHPMNQKIIEANEFALLKSLKSRNSGADKIEYYSSDGYFFAGFRLENGKGRCWYLLNPKAGMKFKTLVPGPIGFSISTIEISKINEYCKYGISDDVYSELCQHIDDQSPIKRRH